MMKTLVVVEMLLLWVGTIAHYQERFGGLEGTVSHVGIRSAVPTALLGFWLLLLADLGGGNIAALLGGIIVFSYLTQAVDTLNQITDSLLQISTGAGQE